MNLLTIPSSPRTLALTLKTHTLLLRSVSSSSNPICAVELVENSVLLELPTPQLLTRADGLLGLIYNSGHVFVCVVTASEAVAEPLTGQKVRIVRNVGFYALTSSQWDRAKDPELDDGPCADLRALLSDGLFFFSTDCDLTNNLQTRGVGPGLLVLDTYQQGYMWNSFMMSEMLEYRSSCKESEKNALDTNGLLTTVIRGFAKTVPCDVGGVPGQILLLSRQLWHRAGTRFNARGVGDDGAVANYVETEVIVDVPDRITCSWTQLRGLVPVFWEQDATQLTLGNPKVQITRLTEATTGVFKKHFDQIEDRYGGVHVVNLLSRKSGERELLERYSQHIDIYNKAEGEKKQIHLTEFDFHAQTKNGNYSQASRVLRYLRELLETFEYFLYDQRNKKIVTTQAGVFRTNCLDCLDRTNVVQTIILGAILQLFLQDYGLPLGSLKAAHDLLWADNGDQISQMYTGTNALKLSFSRNGGKLTLGLYLSDVTKLMTRMYQNNFVDSRKQITIDTLLGRLPAAASIPVALHNPVAELVSSAMSLVASQYETEQIKTIFCGTFNVNGIGLSGRGGRDLDSLAEWLIPQNAEFFYDDQPDVYVLGFQEVVELNATNLLNVDYLKLAAWQKAVGSILSSVDTGGDGYTLLRLEQMSLLLILLFAKKSLADKITLVEGFSKKTGLGGIAGNKGGVAVRFNIGETLFCVINLHLASGLAAVLERNTDYELIAESVYFSRKGGGLKDHENVIWLGDLNYRLSGEIDPRVILGNTADDAIGSDMGPVLMHDQLLNEIHANRAFRGFSEAEIHFPPTYKFDNYTNTYDTLEKQRVPSWTDRVLFKGRKLEVLKYDMVKDVLFSDHKPVYCLFETSVRFVDSEMKQKLYKKFYDSYKNEVKEDSGVLASIRDKKSILLAKPRLPTRRHTETVDLLLLQDDHKPPPAPPARKATSPETLHPPGFSEVLLPAKKENVKKPVPKKAFTLEDLRLEAKKQVEGKKAPPVPAPRKGAGNAHANGAGAENDGSDDKANPIADSANETSKASRASSTKSASPLPPGFGTTLVPTRTASPKVQSTLSSSKSVPTENKVPPPKPPKPEKLKTPAMKAAMSDWQPLVPK